MVVRAYYRQEGGPTLLTLTLGAFGSPCKEVWHFQTDRFWSAHRPRTRLLQEMLGQADIRTAMHYVRYIDKALDWRRDAGTNACQRSTPSYKRP